QLFYSHIAYPETHPKILKMVNYDPRNEKNTKFTISPYNDGDEKHYPIKELKLRESELFYVYRGKRRLVVVLGYIKSSWVKNNPEEYLLCAPVFSFKPAQTQEMIIKTQAFLNPGLFYMPPDMNGCPEESAIRFEMIQPVVRNCLDPFFCYGEGKPVCLSKEAYWILLCHLLKFLNGKVLDQKTEEYMKFYGEYLMEGFIENP
ncbi:MAG: hypothetical protein Q8M92_01940, partial [Candidatus Subteraquimicrobiales bacterium]|nr:hypothetical protein [Candidatus Subteraquimicrobiales bacterium]